MNIFMYICVYAYIQLQAHTYIKNLYKCRNIFDNIKTVS
jgi:hypothetical protein